VTIKAAVRAVNMTDFIVALRTKDLVPCLQHRKIELNGA